VDNKRIATVRKQQANSQDVETRPSGVSEAEIKKGPKLPTLDESINAADQGIRFDHE
jgi:hypothetical protein